MTAAVGDFTPEDVQTEKIQKESRESLVLKLYPTPDILMEIAKQKTCQIVVGFAAETCLLYTSPSPRDRG